MSVFFIAEPKPTLELSDLESHRSWSSFLKGIVSHKKIYTCPYVILIIFCSSIESLDNHYFQAS